MDEYARINRSYWDERAPAHAASPDYAVARFADDPQFRSDVVRYDLPRLGDISSLDLVHLQCHIGTDTVSLARLGARVTGVDLSAPALEEAQRLAAAAGVEASFVQAELYDAPRALADARFDMVYTGIGALCGCRISTAGRRSSRRSFAPVAGCTSGRAPSSSRVRERKSARASG